MTDYAQFEKRLAVLSTKHKKMARGYTAKIGPDGLITVEPKRARFPIRPRTIVFTVVGILLFKSLMIVSTGLATYEGRIERLEAGTMFEQVVAWVMQPDVVSSYMAETIVTKLP
ncbi:hypothetical protein [uncultured Roseobacter sp.]|uniref:hypothetical protein n=1 Tax=uncultured Roseobacter sp. TaxID=114847 RepID=UPI00262E9B1B|nr:hypothetical protein [uncultured Roseobacter sp.]